MIFLLSVNDFEVFIFQSFPALDQEAIRITAQVDADAVYLQLLADVAGNDVGVVAAFGEVIICAFGRAVSQVKRFTKACLVGFIVGRQGKKSWWKVLI